MWLVLVDKVQDSHSLQTKTQIYRCTRTDPNPYSPESVTVLVASSDDSIANESPSTFLQLRQRNTSGAEIMGDDSS